MAKLQKPDRVQTEQRQNPDIRTQIHHYLNTDQKMIVQLTNDWMNSVLDWQTRPYGGLGPRGSSTPELRRAHHQRKHVYCVAFAFWALMGLAPMGPP